MPPGDVEGDTGLSFPLSLGGLGSFRFLLGSGGLLSFCWESALGVSFTVDSQADFLQSFNM